MHSKVSDCTYALDDTDTGSNSCTFTLTCANSAVCIKTKLKMNLEYEVKENEEKDTLPDGTKKITYTAKVSKATHSYSTYTITHLTAEGGTSG